jgi:type IV pilus assembly protein PilX
MKTLQKLYSVECGVMQVGSGVSVKPASLRVRYREQRGVVLFLTLLALLAMSLAAVALIRSVDTSTLIAGNLSFKQSGTSSGDARIEDAIAWLTATETANGGKNVLNDATHTFNQTFPAQGYYSYVDGTSLTDTSVTPHFNWGDADSSPPKLDAAGNTKRYIIQRMCRTVNTVVQNNECLFGGAPLLNNSGQQIPYPSDQCNGPGCPAQGQVPQFRITVQSIGPKNSISYSQAFAY